MKNQTLLDHYRNGAHKLVWDELRAGSVPSEIAEAIAAETMRRVRHNVEELMARLGTEGYRFHANQPHAKPDTHTSEIIASIEQIGPMPLALRTFIEEVGEVNLMGSHPEWDGDGYGDLYTDPLVVEFEGRTYGQENPRYILEQYREWQDAVAKEGEEAIGPFRFDIAPDYYHKANVSGGAPYSIQFPSRAHDATIQLGDHEMWFVDYLRDCFKWGGFPGFKERAAGHDGGTVERLAKDLLQF